MKGFSGFKSPLKQDYKVLDDKELEESRKRMNSRADAIEQIKSMENRSLEAEDYMAKGAKEGVAAINRQLKEKRIKKVTDKWDKKMPGKIKKKEV
jgi:hypothetical protein|tara:strand:- start:5 stop:289 length:285 start_codon:yes stop_codon:yes gene_type:complete